MRDSGPKRALLSGVSIYMNPLMVVGGVGKSVDSFLAYSAIWRKSKIDSYELLEPFDSMNWCWHVSKRSIIFGRRGFRLYTVRRVSEEARRY